MSVKFKPSRILFVASIVFSVFIVLGILLTVVLNSLSKGWFSGVLPPYLTTEWYAYAANDHDIPSLLGVTFTVVIADVLISLLIAFPAAYVLARHEFKGKALLLSAFLLPMIVPPMTYGLPLAMLAYKVHIAARVIGVVIVNLVPIVPFMVLVLLPFIEQVGTNLESAAKMLGANRWTIFRRVLVPLTVPGRASRARTSSVKASRTERRRRLGWGGKLWRTRGRGEQYHGPVRGARTPTACQSQWSRRGEIRRGPGWGPGLTRPKVRAPSWASSSSAAR